MKTPGAVFATFEGIEGSGKTTAAREFVRRLNEIGRESVYFQEPGGCSLSDRIRELLLFGSQNITNEAELMLFMASRAQAMSETVKPALEAGNIVVGDRHIDSTVAYQGYGRGLDIDRINDLNGFVCKGIVPDITFLLDLPVEIGLNRQRCLDRISKQQMEFHEKVRKGFLEIAEANPSRIHIIDAMQPLEIMIDLAWQVFSSFLR